MGLTTSLPLVSAIPVEVGGIANPLTLIGVEHTMAGPSIRGQLGPSPPPEFVPDSAHKV